MKLSIIIPTCNEEKDVSKLIECLLKLSLEKEIVVSDDGSTDKTLEVLEKYNLDNKIKENILHCILSHRYRNEHKPTTIEAKILFDADKLDSIGAVGVARDFLFAGSAGSNCLYTGNEKKLMKNARNFSYTKEDSALLEYLFKLRKIKSKILTKTGKEIAEERHNYMVNFFKRFDLEVKGLL